MNELSKYHAKENSYCIVDLNVERIEQCGYYTLCSGTPIKAKYYF